MHFQTTSTNELCYSTVSAWPATQHIAASLSVTIVAKPIALENKSQERETRLN
jgi:hypothetical protein